MVERSEQQKYSVHSDCKVVLQSGASSLTHDLWQSTDTQTGFILAYHQVTHRLNCY